MLTRAIRFLPLFCAACGLLADDLKPTESCETTSDCPAGTVCDRLNAACIEESPGQLIGGFTCQVYPEPVIDDAVDHVGRTDMLGYVLEPTGDLQTLALVTGPHCFFDEDNFYFTSHDPSGGDDTFRLWLEVDRALVDEAAFVPGEHIPFRHALVVRHSHLFLQEFEHAESTTGFMTLHAVPAPNHPELDGYVDIEGLTLCPGEVCTADSPLEEHLAP